MLDSQEQEGADREFLDQLDEELKDIEEEEDVPPNMEVVDEFFSDIEQSQVIMRARKTVAHHSCYDDQIYTGCPKKRLLRIQQIEG